MQAYRPQKQPANLRPWPQVRQGRKPAYRPVAAWQGPKLRVRVAQRQVQDQMQPLDQAQVRVRAQALVRVLALVQALVRVLAQPWFPAFASSASSTRCIPPRYLQREYRHPPLHKWLGNLGMLSA
jgi:hypothetical protein